jgi:hypothetical protein
MRASSGTLGRNAGERIYADRDFVFASLAGTVAAAQTQFFSVRAP